MKRTTIYSHAFHRAARPSGVRQIHFSREMVESISIHAPPMKKTAIRVACTPMSGTISIHTPAKITSQPIRPHPSGKCAFNTQGRTARLFQSTLPAPFPAHTAFTASRAGFSPAQPAPPRPARKTAPRTAPRSPCPEAPCPRKTPRAASESSRRSRDRAATDHC